MEKNFIFQEDKKITKEELRTNSNNKQITPGNILKDLETDKKNIRSVDKKINKKKRIKDDASSGSENIDKQSEAVKKSKEIKNVVVGNYVMLVEMGKGAFGQIYLSYSLRDEEEVALKKEQKKLNSTRSSPQLKTEFAIYKTLLHINQQTPMIESKNIEFQSDFSGANKIPQLEVQGIPKFYGYGEMNDFYYIIMQLLGPNLIELLTYCNYKKFTITTVAMLALQMLNRIEYMHKHHYIHRDIKPENFLIGNADKTNIVYLIDYGLCKKYKDPKTLQHIPYREGRSLTGTARYVSINTHLGIEQSRRDDLESIGYVLVFFLKVNLPWQGIKAAHGKYTKIMEKKLQIPIELLCYGLPDELIYYLNYCRSLRFEDRPDYDYLRGLFIKLLSNCLTMFSLTKENLKFDWCYDDPKFIWEKFNIKKKNKKLTVDLDAKDSSFTPKPKDKFDPSTNSRESKVNKLESKYKVDMSQIEESKEIGENSHEIKSNESSKDFHNYGSSQDNDSESTVEYELSKIKFFQQSMNNEIGSFGEINNKYELEDIDLYISRLQDRYRADNEQQIESLDLTRTDKEIRGSILKNKQENSLIIEKNQKENPASLLVHKDSLKISKRKLSFVQNESEISDGTEEISQNNRNIHNLHSKSEINSQSDEVSNSQFLSKKLTLNHDNKQNKKDENVILESTSKKQYITINQQSIERLLSLNERPKQSLEEESKQSSSKFIESELDLKAKKLQIHTSNISLNQPGKDTSTDLTKKLPDNKNRKHIFQEDEVNPININKTNNTNEDKKESQSSKSIELKSSSKTNEASKTKDNRRDSKMPTMVFSKNKLVKISNEPILKYYIILGDLGTGSYGCVKKVKHRQLGEIRAMKIVKKNSPSSQNEIEILKKISHPNIISIYEIFEDSINYYIMTEYLEGGELFDMITKQHVLSEVDAAKILKQLLKGVNYLHNMNIVHRDLKPENIMLLKRNDSNYDLKLIDFGTTKLFEKGESLTKFIGTSYYIAPEVLKEYYNEKCDIWSCGVIMYILLTGYPPFNGNSNKEIYNSIKHERLHYDSEEWKYVSSEAIDLLKQMLEKQPDRRSSADACLNHKWFKVMEVEEDRGQSKRNKNISIKAIQKMKNFVQQNRLKQAVLQYISAQFNLKEEEERLRKVFMQFDPYKKGSISKSDFRNTLVNLFGENEAVRIADEIFLRIDLDKSGEISYNEFITSILDDKSYVTNERLEKAFKMFDKDKNGKISVEEIISVFGGDMENWRKIIKDIDLNNDGEIDFKEFKLMMNEWEDR